MCKEKCGNPDRYTLSIIMGSAAIVAEMSDKQIKDMWEGLCKPPWQLKDNSNK